MGRTQAGNNNAYCQDNDISWVHWDDADQDLYRFTKRLIEIFWANPLFRRRTFFTGRPIPGEMVKDLTWIRPDGAEMTTDDWNDARNQGVGMLVHGEATDEVDDRGRPLRGETVLLLTNASTRSRYFALPKVDGLGGWEILVDTARDPRPVRADGVNVAPHSLMLLQFSET
jgi:glycogen operon protein